VQDVEGGGGERSLGERDAEGELIWAGAGGGGNVVELGREDGAEGAVDLVADRFDGRNDDGDGGGGSGGEAAAQPDRAGGELGGPVGRRGEDEVESGRRLRKVFDGDARGAEGVEQSVLRKGGRVEAGEEQTGGEMEAACGDVAEPAQRDSKARTQRAKAPVSELPGKAWRRSRPRQAWSSDQAAEASSASAWMGWTLEVAASRSMMERQRACSCARLRSRPVALP